MALRQATSNALASCKIRTFEKAFSDCGCCRLMRSSGSFPTCSTCNNAADLLRYNDGRWLTDPQRDLVKQYKKLHVDHQTEEVLFLIIARYT